MIPSNRSQAIEAVDVLSDLILDLIAGVMIFREYAVSSQRKPMPPEQLISVKRLCTFHLVLNLCKYIEFWKRYKSILPEQSKGAIKDQVKLLEARKIIEFRNKYVGHIWDDEFKRPLAHSEILTRIESIYQNDLDGWLNWINNPRENVFPKTVLSVIESTKDALMSEFQITENEVIGR